MSEGNDIPELIPNEFGLLSTPYFVTFLEPDKRLVGQISQYNISSKLNTIFWSNRFLGKKYSDILKEKLEQSLPFKIIDDEESNKINIEISFVENGSTIKKYYYPEQISAIILKKKMMLKNIFQEEKISILLHISIKSKEKQKNKLQRLQTQK